MPSHMRTRIEYFTLAKIPVSSITSYFPNHVYVGKGDNYSKLIEFWGTENLSTIDDSGIPEFLPRKLNENWDYFVPLNVWIDKMSKSDPIHEMQKEYKEASKLKYKHVYYKDNTQPKYVDDVEIICTPLSANERDNIKRINREIEEKGYSIVIRIDNNIYCASMAHSLVSVVVKDKNTSKMYDIKYSQNTRKFMFPKTDISYSQILESHNFLSDIKEHSEIKDNDLSGVKIGGIMLDLEDITKLKDVIV